MVYRFGGFQVDEADFRLTAGSATVALEPKALRLLLYLVQNPGRLVRKQELLAAVWQETSVTENALTRSIGLLRRTLDDRGRPPQYIETVPTVGYRFIAAVEIVQTPPAKVSSPHPAPQDLAATNPALTETSARPAHRISRLLLVSSLALACIALLGAAWAIHNRLQNSHAIRSLAVLPLENLSGDPAQDYFADGTTDELITELARIPTLRVVSRTSVMRDKGANKSLQQIAAELNVDAVVEGSIVRSGDRVRITAQLIDTRTDRHLWAQSFEGHSSDMLSLQDSVADQIAAGARAVLVPRDAASAHSINEAAHDAYLRGRYFLQKDDFTQSAASFRAAIAADASYASAYAGLADALDAQTMFGRVRAEDAMPQALAAARTAIQLDPQNGEAYAALGSIQTVYQRNWSEAERSLTRAISLSPNYAMAEMKYAALLDITGNPVDAVTHMRRAVSLDPLSFFMNRRLGSTLYLAHRYDEALAQFARAAELEPEQSHEFDFYKSAIFAAKGMHDQAVEYDLMSISGGSPGIDTRPLRDAYAHSGWNGYLAARIRTLEPRVDHGCVPYDLAASYLALGDRDRAFPLLDQAVKQQCLWMVWTKVDPVLDSLRNDARYPPLLRQLNLGT